MIAEFKLSKREGEILKLVARGYTVDNISNKLVISPYTTQTHIRHIYAKMNIHKRSELLDYINMHRDSESPYAPPQRPRRSNGNGRRWRGALRGASFVLGKRTEKKRSVSLHQIRADTVRRRRLRIATQAIF